MSIINSSVQNIIEFSSAEVELEINTLVVKDCVKGLTTNMLNAFQTIVENSINKMDYDRKILDMCNKYGLQKAKDKFF